MGKKNENKDDGLGPGQYKVKEAKAGPFFTFGSRFNSSFRNKDHLKPRKVDGPGPGAYKMPTSLKTGKRTQSSNDAMKKSTFGNADRNFSDLPKDIPGPGAYYPQKFTEASYQYSIPKEKTGDINALKNAQTPGPQQYFN